MPVDFTEEYTTIEGAFSGFFVMRNYPSLGFAFCLAVAITTALAAGPSTDANVDSSQAALDRLTAMPPAKQQAWLKRLEERANRAASLAFKPKEAAEHQAAIHGKLHQKSITWEVLREAIQETDAWEKDAIKRLSKDYRLKVFEIFHQDLHAYADRQRAWLDLQQNWKDAGSPFESQDRLVDWLEGSLRDIKSSKPSPIRSKPSFEVEKLPAVVVKPRDAKPQAVEKPREITKPQAVVQAQQPKKKPQTPVKTPLVELPPMPAIEPAVTPPERALARIPLHQQENNSATSVLPPVDLQHVKSLSPSPPSLNDFDLPKRKPQLLGETQPVVSPDVLREITASSSSSPPASSAEPTASEPSPPGTIEVKIGELSARIGGCNLAFRAMETELDEKGEWDATKLEPYMDRLKLLITRRHDLNLFRNALSESQRSSVEPLASEKSAVSQFAACIATARQRAFNGNYPDRQTELERLEKLSRQLAEMAGQ
jgi:hypothetical protein